MWVWLRALARECRSVRWPERRFPDMANESEYCSPHNDRLLRFIFYVPVEPREDHASYIATWLKVVAADNRAVFTAAAYAQRAAEFIDRKQPWAPPLKSPRLARHDRAPHLQKRSQLQSNLACAPKAALA